MIKCENDRKCVPLYSVCDGNYAPGCSDGSDESETFCRGKRMLIVKTCYVA